MHSLQYPEVADVKIPSHSGHGKGLIPAAHVNKGYKYKYMRPRGLDTSMASHAYVEALVATPPNKLKQDIIKLMLIICRKYVHCVDNKNTIVPTSVILLAKQ